MQQNLHTTKVRHGLQSSGKCRHIGLNLMNIAHLKLCKNELVFELVIDLTISPSFYNPLLTIYGKIDQILHSKCEMTF